MEKLINQLKELGDSAHIAGEFELSTVLLEAEKTIRTLDKEVEIAQHNAARATREQCVDDLLESVYTEKVRLCGSLFLKRFEDMPEWLQQVFGGEA